MVLSETDPVDPVVTDLFLETLQLMGQKRRPMGWNLYQDGREGQPSLMVRLRKRFTLSSRKLFEVHGKDELMFAD